MRADLAFRRPDADHPHPRPGRQLALTAPLATAALTLGGCGAQRILPQPAPGQIVAIGAERQYANVISQVGGRYVAVAAVERNPSADPHSYETSPGIAAAIARAGLVVQNGLGYDPFMERIESATPNASRHVIDVQRLLGLPDTTPNPHLWYAPRTMPALATAIATALGALTPRHAAYFAANARRFNASLRPWLRALARLRDRRPQAPVASTEPVGDYLLQAAGARDLTPWNLQAAIMNGVDPAAQDIDRERSLLQHHRAKALVYNAQVTDTLTQTFLTDAEHAGVPEVAIYETLPDGYDYQTWMLAETRALAAAIEHGTATRRL
jgi:zinc/manganese transport system substrate-binding protein